MAPGIFFNTLESLSFNSGISTHRVYWANVRMKVFLLSVVNYVITRKYSLSFPAEGWLQFSATQMLSVDNVFVLGH